MDTLISCPVCGTQFTPTHQGCSTCPLHNGCTLTCCPACGHTTIDPNRSKLVQITTKIRERWIKARQIGLKN